MKYIALLSGGKDSCYNLVHCAHHGHELVAAGSLGPPEGKEELDSYLYQTVGQDAIEFIAQALEVPLYRRVITGVALEQGSEYGSRIGGSVGSVHGDETEDLYELLFHVKRQHPAIQGVSVGAILSNYQRVRVEHVCSRLGLTPLCYLWQRDQGQLLSEMVQAGMEAILIKVAGIGLTVKHLGKSLGEMQPTLVKLNQLYGSHICGEGGEYESLTLDCPLFKHKIVLTEVETVIHSDSDFATVAYLRIKQAHLVAKTTPSVSAVIPSLLEERYMAIEHALKEAQPFSTPVSNEIALAEEAGSLPEIRPSIHQVGPWVAIANVQADGEQNASQISLEEEVSGCFIKVKDMLGLHSLTLSDLTFVTVLLSDMALFPTVNSVYMRFFGVSPPARACVAVSLPSPHRIRIDCLAFAEIPERLTRRKALHVQGLSYWAPANIGPYSQAVKMDQCIFISGQIGLVPSSLTLPSPPSLARETALCFQHVERVKRAITDDLSEATSIFAQCVLYWLAPGTDLYRVRQACEVYGKDEASPTLFLTVAALPKGALIEKQTLLHTGRVEVDDEDEGEPPFWQSKMPQISEGELLDRGFKIYWKTSTLSGNLAECAVICVLCTGGPFATEDIVRQLKSILSLGPFRNHALSIRAFHSVHSKSNFVPVVHALYEEARPALTAIPCHRIATMGTDNWDFALCILGA